MGVSAVVLWWEEWQLRVLVLASLFLQYFLAFAAPTRKHFIRPSFRFFIWLAYLGSDAVAIYGLATLFNRHKQPVAEVDRAVNGSRVLEVLWAPVLLFHLAGQDSITAYNIEDNELWRRHVLTVISQVTVALYVFCKTWSGEKKLLRTAILLFVAGILKCIDKPIALMSASIYNLVSSSPPRVQGQKSTPDGEEDKASSLDDFIQKATKLSFKAQPDAEDLPKVLIDSPYLARRPYRLFVDLVSPYDHRLGVLEYFLTLSNKDADKLLQIGLCNTFDRFYTKGSGYSDFDGKPTKRLVFGVVIREFALCVAFSAIALFHQSHKDAYNSNDVKVTYTLICCTAVLELLAMYLGNSLGFEWSDRVAQYNLISSFTRHKNPTMLLKLAHFRPCKDYVDQHWYVDQCKSSLKITNLVIQQVIDGWKKYIRDTQTYWMFNDRRGQYTLMEEGCNQEVRSTLDAPFDDSVLVWHIATDICFYCDGDAYKGPLHHQTASRCKEISDYMFYLLVACPDMLMAGTRGRIFSTVHNELESMFKDEKPSPGEVDLRGEIYWRAQRPSPDAAATEEFVLRASALVTQLLKLDADKRWRVMQGVWVEMLCFSASRCRGYLHAKSLGNGGEYLSYVWLALSHLGMETVAERQQRSDFKGPVPRFDPSRRAETEQRTQGSGSQEEEGAVVSEIREEEGSVKSEIQQEDGAIRLEIPEEEKPTAASHYAPKPKATVSGDDNV